MKYIWKFFLIIVTFISCNKNNSNDAIHFPNCTQLSIVDSINLEELNILKPYNFRKIDSLFFFSVLSESYCISIFNNKNKETKNIIDKGNGPNEFIGYIEVKNNRDNVFTCSDRYKKNIVSINCRDNKISIVEETRMPDTIPNLFSLVELNDSILIATGFFTKGRLIMYNKHANTFSYYGSYPENDDIKKIPSRHKAALFNSSFIAIHPDGKKFAVIYKGLLDFYEYSNTQIELRKSNHYFYPQFKTNNTGAAIIYDKKTIVGFFNVSCDSEYLYLCYTNESFDKTLKTNRSIWSNVIAVFDWDGNPITKYVLEEPAISLYVEKDTLWAISSHYTKLYKYIIPQNRK